LSVWFEVGQHPDDLANGVTDCGVAFVDALVAAIILNHDNAVDELSELPPNLLKILSYGVNLKPKTAVAVNEANTDVVNYKSRPLALDLYLLNQAIGCRTDVKDARNADFVISPQSKHFVAEALNRGESV